MGGAYLHQLGVILPDCSGVDDEVNVLRDIGSFLSVKYGDSHLLQMPGEPGFPGIGAGDGKVLIFEYFSKTAHADAADTDKMDMYRVLKIDFIHSLVTCLLKNRICMIHYTRILMICKFFWYKIFSTGYGRRAADWKIFV